MHLDHSSALQCRRVHLDAFQCTGIMGVHWDETAQGCMRGHCGDGCMRGHCGDCNDLCDNCVRVQRDA